MEISKNVAMVAFQHATVEAVKLMCKMGWLDNAVPEQIGQYAACLHAVLFGTDTEMAPLDPEGGRP